MESHAFVRELALMNDQPRVRFAVFYEFWDLIEVHDVKVESITRFSQAKLKCQKRRRQLSRDCDALAAKLLDAHRLTRDHHRPVLVAHAAAAVSEGIVARNIRIRMNRDGRDLQLA